MKLKGIVLLCVAAVAVPAFGQAAASADGNAQYVGVVNGTNVFVRHNASMTAYPCAMVSRPQNVTVVGQAVSGWLKILPPPGVFSVIAKKYVQADQTSKSGTVTGDNVWVRAGGQLRKTSFFGLQKQLNTGQKVEILGEIDDWYKIVPPKGVYFHISARYVKVGQATGAASPSNASPAAAAQPPKAVPSTKKLPTTLPAAQTLPVEGEPGKDLAAFRALEAQLHLEFNKPPAQRDLARLLGKFKALKPAPDSYLKPYVDYYVAYLDMAIAQQAGRKQLQQLVRSAAESQAEYEMRRTALEVADTTTRKAIYAAQGVLATSAIYTGAGGPKRHLLRDVKTGAVIAYVKSADDSVQLDKYVGRYVGILGSVRYDGQVQTDLVQARQVVVLDKATAGLPGPPKPVIGAFPPIPKPVTKPKPAVEAAPAAKLKPDQIKPKSKPVVETKPKPVEKSKPTPAPGPAKKVAPKPKPATKPKPKQASRPATRPAANPMPPNGLPIVKPTIAEPEPIDEEEYD